jgi:hypothetical protein
VGLVAASVVCAILLTLVSGVRVDPDGLAPLAWIVAALLIVSRMWWIGAGHRRVADFFGTLSLVWFGGVSCGAIAMLGLRLRLPLTDRLLLSADHALGISPVAIVAWLVKQGQWIFSIMAMAYGYTIPIFVLSMVALALSGNRLEAWRAAFCFLGSLVSICAIAIFTPAKGLALWAPSLLLARLPAGAMRYFWTNFDAFYAGPDPVLRLQSIDGVISFPSFHAAMGFVTLGMWRRNPVMLPLALAWLVFMLLATFPYGGHYFVDVAAGGVVWALWFALSRKLERRPGAIMP